MRFSSSFWDGLTVSGRKDDGFSVPLFSQRFPYFFTKYDSRSQVITNLKIKATNNCLGRYNFANIVLVFKFSSGFKALEVIKMIKRQSSAAKN